MRLGFETLGNATLVFYEEDKPILATDPWLEGTCYFGSWALDRPLTGSEINAVLSAEYLWISHGHPDHFHIPSLARLPRGKKILLPDHYATDIRNYLEKQGFAVEVLGYRQWRRLSPKIRCLCLDNENQDAILVIEAGDNLVLDLNDSPQCGEKRFIRKLVQQYDRKRTYMAALCSNDADMFNIVGPDGRRVIDSPEQRKPGMVWDRARLAEGLGVGAYVASASQHIYVRSDSVWANPYRVGWADVLRHWTRPSIRTIEPFVVLDLENGEYRRKHPSQSSDESKITSATGSDDWTAQLGEEEWGTLCRFFAEIDTLRPYIDYIDFTVGGEKRRVWRNSRTPRRKSERLRGIAFNAPRQSLMKAVQLGYFDDMLIGNFMRTELHNVALYPHFTPLVAKLRGNAKVFTRSDLRRFNRRYFRRNPLGYIEWRLEQHLERITDWMRRNADLLGMKLPLKRLYRRLRGDPII
jgi:hypothetical protein